MAESPMRSIGSAIHRFVEPHHEARMWTELLSLDDHALTDIGLSRSDLEHRESPLMTRTDEDLPRGPPTH